MLLWIKIKQKYLKRCIDYAPSCVHYCKKHAQEGAWLLKIFFQIYNKQEVQVNLSIIL